MLLCLSILAGIRPCWPRVSAVHTEQWLWDYGTEQTCYAPLLPANSCRGLLSPAGRDLATNKPEVA